MKRNTYKFRGEYLGPGQLFQLVPVSRIAVVPGETLKGQVCIDFMTDTLSRPWLNSAVVQAWAFYVPNRIVWEDWVDFITGASGAPTAVPTNSNAASQMFEQGTLAKNGLYRRAYSAIVNRYFRPEEDGERGPTDAGLHTLPFLKNFMTTMQDDVDAARQLADVIVDDAGVDKVDMDGLRLAYQTQREANRRALYGEKYADFLASMGSNAFAGLIDEPELIGQSSMRLKFDDVRQPTSAGSSIPTSGAKGTLKLKLRGDRSDKVAIQEHGYVTVLMAIRVQVQNSLSVGPYDLLDSAREDFWLPEFSGTPFRDAKAGYIDRDSPAGGQQYEAYGHLKRGDNQLSNPISNGWALSFGATADSGEGFRTPNPSSFNGFFANTIGGNWHYFFGAWNDVMRISPIPRGRP